jgi:hypothetical protein
MPDRNPTLYYIVIAMPYSTSNTFLNFHYDVYQGNFAFLLEDFQNVKCTYPSTFLCGALETKVI